MTMSSPEYVKRMVDELAESLLAAARDPLERYKAEVAVKILRDAMRGKRSLVNLLVVYAVGFSPEQAVATLEAYVSSLAVLFAQARITLKPIDYDELSSIFDIPLLSTLVRG